MHFSSDLETTALMSGLKSGGRSKVLWLNPQYLHKVLSYARALSPKVRWATILKFIFNSITHPAHHAEWFDYLENGLPPSVPREKVRHLIEYTARRYMRVWFSAQERIDIFRRHYDLFGECFSPVMLQRMRDHPGFLLGELTGKSGRQYKVTLYHAMTREGEIEFSLTDTDLNMKLMKILGTFGREADGRTVFWVGAIQGLRHPMGREEIARATRDLNVLRPKQVVLHAAGIFSAWMGVETLYLPPRMNHVTYRRWRFGVSQVEIFNDYESFWAELTTQKTGWGDYRLPLPLPRRQIENVPSKRRKDWLRRHVHLDALAESITANLEASRRIDNIRQTGIEKSTPGRG